MRRSSGRATVAAFAATAGCVAVVFALVPAGAQAKQARVKVVTESQQDILQGGAIKVRVDGLAGRRIRLGATSRTFDLPEQAKLSRAGRATPGKRTVKLPLGSSGQAKVESCEARTIRVHGKGAKATKFSLRRDSAGCRPRPIDLSRAGECSVVTLDEGAEAGVPECMLPFPDNFHTVADETSATGRRIAFDDAAMPTNSGGTPIDAAPYNLNDGFSPGQTTVVRVPGLDTPEAFTATDPIRLDGLSRNDLERPGEPVVVIDATTGERWPIWVELDSNAETPEETALLIHPARNYEAGHRYVVALRQPEGRGRWPAIRAGGLPLPPRPAAVGQLGDQLATQAVRAGVPGAAGG